MQNQGQLKEDRDMSERAAFYNEIIARYGAILREYSKYFRK